MVSVGLSLPWKPGIHTDPYIYTHTHNVCNYYVYGTQAFTVARGKKRRNCRVCVSVSDFLATQWTLTLTHSHTHTLTHPHGLIQRQMPRWPCKADSWWRSDPSSFSQCEWGSNRATWNVCHHPERMSGGCRIIHTPQSRPELCNWKRKWEMLDFCFVF